MQKTIGSFIVLLFILGLSQCRKPEPFEESEYDERMSGGGQTAFDATSQAYSHAFSGMSDYDESIHEIGDAGFEQTFITAPASLNGGLGPVFNNVSCLSCHHNDGKGVPTAGQSNSGLLVRISSPGADPYHGAVPVTGYGTQVQDKAIFGKLPEARILVSYSNQTVTFPDGESIELRAPEYTLTDLHTPVNGSYLLSARLAPPVFGLGLIESIPEDQIVSFADPSDANQDGISGKANYVWNPHTQSRELGRFGLKLNTSSLLVQVAAAYNNDIGITSPVFQTETSDGQPNQSDGLDDDPELSAEILNAVTFYIKTLQVPARRNVTDPQVIRGRQVFEEANCSGCHRTSFTTGVNVAFPAASYQRIHPYTDLLLHDMGEGLADHRPDFDADGYEWRTAPLWGVGLIETVNYPGYYMHDGRARTLLEAIMWHGGEAEQSKNKVGQLSRSDREALIKFLKSL